MLDRCLDNSTSRCNNCDLPLVNGGIARNAPTSASSSEISNIYQQVLDLRVLNVALLIVKCLSET